MNVISTACRWLIALSVILLVACSEPAAPGDNSIPPNMIGESLNTQTSAIESNPFFSDSPLYLNFPEFDRIRNAHYLPAFERGMVEQKAEVEAISSQAAAPSFENTLVALELSGQLLNRVSAVFFTLNGTNTNEEMQAIDQQLAPLLAAHDDSILFNAALFQRIESLYDARAELPLSDEQRRLVEKYHADFVRAGANLDFAQKARMSEINALLALLQIKYNENILDEMNALSILVDTREELAGLDEASIATAAAAAEAQDLPGKFLLPLVNTSGQPLLTRLENRALRERIQQTSESRGSRGGEFDNREVLTNILQLRAERAQLLGFENHAAYVLDNQTARTVAAVNQRLAELAPPAVANAKREAADLQELVDASGGDFTLASWDWNFYSEQLRAARFDFDASQLRPYFELNNVLRNGLFYAAEQLYGISFQERLDLPKYHPDTHVFEVIDVAGTTLGIFIQDYYARSSKRGGAWNSSYVVQSDLLGTQPIVANHLNITKPLAGEPTLLTFGEVTTMFHEFGHALHALFSAVEYPYFAGTRVPRDFVEFPSQVNEMWSVWPEVLAHYAVHYETGAPMPQDMLERVLAAQQFNQGFATTEYLAASILDQALHQLTPESVPAAADIMAFEAEVLRNVGIDTDLFPPRYRSTYFRHIMGGYAAGYYSYIWAEVLDADAVEWFRENGGLQRENGDHFRRTLLSRGGTEDALQLYRNFRGRDADIEPLLERRGLK